MPQDLLIQAYREEAALYRRAGKESAAIKLERVADRMQRLMDIYSKKENSNGDRTRQQEQGDGGVHEKKGRGQAHG